MPKKRRKKRNPGYVYATTVTGRKMVLTKKEVNTGTSRRRKWEKGK